MGMRHATDPDHVIAVTTIVSRERRLFAASRVGIVWGLGHTLTVLAVGAAIIVFKIAIPIRLGLAMEFAVAIVLILLGLGAFASFIQLVARRIVGTPLAVDRPLVVHSHAHGHGFGPHRHPHVHLDSSEQHGSEQVALNHEHGLPAGAMSSFAVRRPLLRSFGIGLVHGLAGSAAIALLVLGAIPAAAVGDALPRDFLPGHDCRNGIDHHCYRDALRGCSTAYVVDASKPRHGLRTSELRVRAIPCLSAGNRRSPVRRSSNLDTALTQRRKGDFSLRVCSDHFRFARVRLM